MDGQAPETAPLTTNMQTGDRPASKLSKKCNTAAKKTMVVIH